MPKIYRVLVRGEVTESALRAMRQGMCLSDGQALAPVQAQQLRQNARGDTWLELVLHQGINRQIRRMLQDLNLTILTLNRVQQGPLELGDLKPGQWRHLKDKEVSQLINWTGKEDQES